MNTYRKIIEDVYLLLHFHFRHFQKCHFQIFSEMINWIILTLVEKILILSLEIELLMKFYYNFKGVNIVVYKQTSHVKYVPIKSEFWFWC